MSDYTDFYVGLFTRMHQAEKARADFEDMIEFEKMCELEALQEAWDELSAVPSYVEQQACEFADEIEAWETIDPLEEEEREREARCVRDELLGM